jgi:hypothetical protein
MSALLDLVRAPPEATSRDLRLLGLKATALGLLLLVPGIFWFWLAKDWALDTFGTRVGDTVLLPRPVVVVIGGPMAAGYALLMIGLSRLLFGVASQSKSALASIGRILFGLVVTIGMVVVATMLYIAYARQ